MSYSYLRLTSSARRVPAIEYRLAYERILQLVNDNKVFLEFLDYPDYARKPVEDEKKPRKLSKKEANLQEAISRVDRSRIPEMFRIAGPAPPPPPVGIAIKGLDKNGHSTDPFFLPAESKDLCLDPQIPNDNVLLMWRCHGNVQYRKITKDICRILCDSLPDHFAFSTDENNRYRSYPSSFDAPEKTLVTDKKKLPSSGPASGCCLIM